MSSAHPLIYFNGSIEMLMIDRQSDYVLYSCQDNNYQLDWWGLGRGVSPLSRQLLDIFASEWYILRAF